MHLNTKLYIYIYMIEKPSTIFEIASNEMKIKQTYNQAKQWVELSASFVHRYTITKQSKAL